VYFLYPALGRLLAGTVHLPWTGTVDRPVPHEDDVRRFLGDLNAAIPGLRLRRHDVRRVFAGVLPAAVEGSARLAARPAIVDHAQQGGPEGLVSVSGVKFTTARLVAARTLAILGRRVSRSQVRTDAPRPPAATGLDIDRAGEAFGPATADALRRIARDESVMTVDDLLFRRTNWGLVDDNVDALRRRVVTALGGIIESRPEARHTCVSGQVPP
jgi:glycerol-3-phosphate dehydrogenase